MLYFAYGANLWKRGMMRRCPQARAVGVAQLAGYRLVLRSYADIVADRQGTVSGALWRVTAACRRALDAYEEAPQWYVPIDVTVTTPDGPVSAFAYIMNADTVRRNGAPVPDPAYYGEIARGYNDWKLDPATLRRARFGSPSGVRS